MIESKPLRLETDGRALFLLLLVFLALCVPVTFFSEIDYAAARDERKAHYPLIQRFSQQLPHPDISNYDKAPQTPLYHIFLSIVGVATNDSLPVLRGVNLLVSAAALIIFYVLFRTALPWRQSILATSTIALAPFFFGPATRIMTDNASLLFAMGSLGLLWRGSASTGRLAFAGIMASAAVAIRQTFVWVPVFAAAILARRIGEGSGRVRLAAVFTVLAPMLTLGYFLILWNGIVPPTQQNHWGHAVHGWINLTPLYFGVALVGTYAVFYSLQFWSLYRTQGGTMVPGVAVWILSWAALVLVPFEVSQTVSPGPLHQVSQLFPEVAGTSAIFYLLIPLGVLVILTCALAAKNGRNRFFLYAFIIWLMSTLGYTVFYQRYFEVLVLFFVMYFGLQAETRQRWRWVGPLSLVVCFLVVDIVHHMFTRIS